MGEKMAVIFAIIASSPGKAMAGKDIAKALDAQGKHMDMKTIYKTIREINAFFYPVLQEDMFVPIRKVGWQLRKEYFEDGQLQLLIDAITYNKDLSYNEKQELIDKLTYFSSASQESRLITHVEKDEKPFSLMLNLSVIMKAIATQTNIAFEYVSYEIDENRHPYEVASTHGNHGTTYVVSPYTIVLSNNHYYMIGYFSLRKNSLSMYRIDRMRKVLTRKGAFYDIRDSYDIDDYISRSFNMFINGVETDLVLHFHKGILREVVSRFGENITIESLSGEWYEAVVTAQSYSRGLLSWLLMLGSQVEVVSPKSIREDIRKEVEKTLKHYQ